jgi:hypothetical protein
LAGFENIQQQTLNVEVSHHLINPLAFRVVRVFRGKKIKPIQSLPSRHVSSAADVQRPSFPL